MPLLMFVLGELGASADPVSVAGVLRLATWKRVVIFGGHFRGERPIYPKEGANEDAMQRAQEEDEESSHLTQHHTHHLGSAPKTEAGTVKGVCLGSGRSLHIYLGRERECQISACTFSF